MQDQLAERGVRLYTERDHPGIHVSGHPCRDELKQMYQWARPRIAVPTHGQRRHLIEHCNLAKDMQTPEAVALRNGDLLRLAPGMAEIIDEVPSGRLFVDGGLLTPEGSDALRERKLASVVGVLVVAVAIDCKGRLAGDLEIRGLGLPGDTELDEALDDLADRAADALARLKPADRMDDDAVEQAVSRAVKKAARQAWDRKPMVETLIVRI